jgi:hypothetical protein
MTDIAPPSPRGYVLAADQGLAPDRPDLKASADSTGGQLTVFTLSVDGGPPRHTHTTRTRASTCSPACWRSNATVRSSRRRRVRSCSSPARGRIRSGASAAPPAGCSSSPPAGWRTTSTPCMPPSRPVTRPRSERSRPSTASACRDGEGRLGRPSGSEPAQRLAAPSRSDRVRGSSCVIWHLCVSGSGQPAGVRGPGRVGASAAASPGAAASPLARWPRSWRQPSVRPNPATRGPCGPAGGAVGNAILVRRSRKGETKPEPAVTRRPPAVNPPPESSA